MGTASRWSTWHSASPEPLRSARGGGCDHACVPTFDSYDGTTLSYTIEGSGPPLVCLPGGPARPAGYLGDLGGLAEHRELHRLDFRGTGGSAVPEDEDTYRVDRIVADVESLRAHLELDTFDLLGHSAGASVALLYAVAYPHRLSSLVIVAGSLRVTGLPPVGAQEADDARSTDGSPEPLTPVGYERSEAAAEGFYEDYDASADGVRAGLSALDAPVLVVAGERDIVPTPAAAATVAALFRNASVATIACGGHYPWLDEPRQFVDEVEAFLARR
jgi:pimeloyl-ACP methyl ester carboxylesterase